MDGKEVRKMEQELHQWNNVDNGRRIKQKVREGLRGSEKDVEEERKMEQEVGERWRESGRNMKQEV